MISAVWRAWLPAPTARIEACGGLTIAELRAISAARWPKLESLEIWFGDPEYGATGGVAFTIGTLLKAGIDRLHRAAELARLLALGRDDQHPRGAEHHDDADHNQDHAVATGHFALAPVVVGVADAEPALVESDTVFAESATAEELGSASKMTVALKAASPPEHPPLELDAEEPDEALAVPEVEF